MFVESFKIHQKLPKKLGGKMQIKETRFNRFGFRLIVSITIVLGLSNGWDKTGFFHYFFDIFCMFSTAVASKIAKKN
jgi:hypothetical protein